MRPEPPSWVSSPVWAIMRPEPPLVNLIDSVVLSCVGNNAPRAPSRQSHRLRARSALMGLGLALSPLTCHTAAPSRTHTLTCAPHAVAAKAQRRPGRGAEASTGDSANALAILAARVGVLSPARRGEALRVLVEESERRLIPGELVKMGRRRRAHAQPSSSSGARPSPPATTASRSRVASSPCVPLHPSSECWRRSPA